jgi:succinyl-CoA synthetase beta subunit
MDLFSLPMKPFLQQVAELEGQEAWPLQILMASRMAGIDVEDTNAQVLSTIHSSDMDGAKEEWLLRWLLRKLQIKDAHDCRYVSRKRLCEDVS